MKYWIDIAFADRGNQRHRLEAKKSSLGTSQRADIVLRNAPGVLGEHFFLTPQPDGCWVEVADESPQPFTYEGRPSRGALIPWGQDVFFGALRLSLHAEGQADKESKPSPLLWLGLVVVPFLVFSMVYEPSIEGGGTMAPLSSPPALYGPAPACSAQAGGESGRGSIAEQLARAKRERAVFELSDGVEAVQLMREAAQCYLAAGLEGRAAKVGEIAGDWLRDLEVIYQRTLLHLDLSYRAFDASALQRHGDRLKVLLTYAQGEDAAAFKTWLDDLIRRERARQIAQAQENES